MIILDTNVLSELMRPTPAAHGSEVAKQPSTELFTTSIGEAEMLFGIELFPKSKRRSGIGIPVKIKIPRCLFTSFFN